MKTELEYYEILPKLLPADKESTVTIYPRGRQAEFERGQKYVITVRPLTECDDRNRDRIKDYIVAETEPDERGGFTFSHVFGGEQEHYVRVYKAPIVDGGRNDKLVQLSVYSLKPDLYGLKPLRGDLHVHTFRSDGREAPEIVCANYRKAGFDFMTITDHRRFFPSLEAIDAYREIPTALKIFKGEEVHAPDNHVHIINFAGDISVNECFQADEETYYQEVRQIEAALPDLGEGVDRFVYASCKWCYDKIRSGGGLAIYAHPHWRNDVYNVSDAMSRAQFQNRLFDCFELLNGMEARSNNLQTAFYQQMRAEGCAVPVVGSSDSHGTVNRDNFQWLETVVFAPSDSREDIIESIKAGRSTALEQYPQEYQRAFGNYRYVMYTLFLLEDYFPRHDELCYEEGRLMKEALLGDKEAVRLLAEIKDRAAAYLDRCYRG